ncbi:MAG: hypothetical protein KJ799_13845 [Bacteroidetes bacterium]|nr:hypothetical protein [Bacteroidota bacterium]
MKKYLSFVVLPFLLLTIIFSCSDNSTNPEDELTVKPIVLKTSTNYDEQLFNSLFPQNDILKTMSDAYKNKYSEKIKMQLIDYVVSKVKTLGENEAIFLECFNLSGCQNVNSISLPTYIEKAKYNDEDSWIIQLSWGLESSDLGHYKCFAFGINSKDTLYYTRCK